MQFAAQHQAYGRSFRRPRILERPPRCSACLIRRSRPPANAPARLLSSHEDREQVHSAHPGLDLIHGEVGHGSIGKAGSDYASRRCFGAGRQPRPPDVKSSPISSSSGSGDEVRKLQFEDVEVTPMRSERALVTGMLVIPLVVVFVGWPAFAKWMVAPVADKPAPAPAVTPVAEAQANRSAPRPTDGAPATVAARPVGTKPAPVRMAEPTRVTGADSTQDGQGNSGAPIAPTTAPAVAAEAAQIDSTSDPSATVARFYDLVGQGHYGAAAELWSPHMRATYPPSETLTSGSARRNQ